jgi:hypothetical protein
VRRIPDVKKLATAKTIERIEKYINEYAFSDGYRVDPETLQITSARRKPPLEWRVVRYRGGFMFGSEEAA